MNLLLIILSIEFQKTVSNETFTKYFTSQTLESTTFEIRNALQTEKNNLIMCTIHLY